MYPPRIPKFTAYSNGMEPLTVVSPSILMRTQLQLGLSRVYWGNTSHLQQGISATYQKNDPHNLCFFIANQQINSGNHLGRTNFVSDISMYVLFTVVHVSLY